MSDDRQILRVEERDGHRLEVGVQLLAPQPTPPAPGIWRRIRIRLRRTK